jgi:hypothetical protein
MSTLNGNKITSARVTLPEWGCWYADVSIDGEVALTGRVSLVVADLTLSGTVLSGGAAIGRSSFRIVGGAGGWGKALLKKSYANDAGVKISTILGDAASEAGETIAITADDRVGPAWTRAAGPAVDSLNSVAERAWYVDEVGTTRLGKRVSSTLGTNVTRVVPVDRARGKVVLAAESIAKVLPGVVVDGMAAVDVVHELTPGGGLRSTVWGAQVASPIDALGSLLRQLDPDRAFRGLTEYRVVTLEGARLNLQPVRVSSGMPDLRRVPVWPGVGGCQSTPTLGTRVLVGFIDSDQARPFVAAFEDEDGEGFVPVLLSLAKGVLPAARLTDTVQAGPFAGTITSGSTKVRVG